MKEYIKKIIRFISVKPIIGPPVRIVVAIVRLPQMRDMIFELNHQNNVIKQQIIEVNHQHNVINLQINQQINEINQQVSEINQQVSEINQQVSEINQQVSEINQKVDDVWHHQHVFDTEYWPLLVESLNYQENLKKSLPVVLRQYRRSLPKQEN